MPPTAGDTPGASNSRPCVTAVLRRSHRNYCKPLRLLAVAVCASVALAVWTSSRPGEHRPCEVSTCAGEGESRSAGVPRDGSRPPRVAICFFGLARSLRWTLPSVRKRLLDVLKGAGMEVETFVHTYVMREVREGEGREKQKHISR